MIFNVLGLELTRSCTNRCKYCYGKGRKIVGNMNKETIEKALQIMDEQPIKAFTISLLGGEPSLRLHYFLPILEDFYKKTSKEIFLTINTNGLIFNQDICDQLKKFNAHISLSLDGPKEIHDFNRKLVNGSGTFDLLMNKIPLILKNFPNTLDQATFTPETIHQLSDSYFLAKKLGFKKWYWAPDLYESTWKQSHFEILKGQLKIIAEDYFQQNQIIYENFEKNQTRNQGNSRFGKDSHCLLVNPEGELRISRLNATFLPPEEDVYWKIGNVKTGLDFEKIKNWENRYGKNADTYYFAYNIKQKCQNCKANQICYNAEHSLNNPYLYKIQCAQSRMQCEQKCAIMNSIN